MISYRFSKLFSRFSNSRFSQPFARSTPREWITYEVPACTRRVGLIHTVCGHHSTPESWEFHDRYEPLSGRGEWRRVRAERHRMYLIALAYAAAHRCAIEDSEASR